MVVCHHCQGNVQRSSVLNLVTPFDMQLCGVHQLYCVLFRAATIYHMSLCHDIK